MAVTGFTKEQAPCSNETLSFNTTHYIALVTMYSAYEPPLVNLPPPSDYLVNPTLLPPSLQAMSPPPVAMTTPDPSDPGVNGNWKVPL